MKRYTSVLLVVLCLLHGVTLGQTKKANAASSIPSVWYVTYIVWIKGMGGIAKDGHSKAWTVDRSYGGILVLRQAPGYISPADRQRMANLPKNVPLPPEARAALAAATKQLQHGQWMQVSNPNDPNRRLTSVKINDEYEEVSNDRGGEGGVGKCRLTFRSTWNYDGKAKAAGTALLSYDAALNATILGFGINPSPPEDGSSPVKYAYERNSSGGFCGESKSDSRMLAFSETEIPEIKNLITANGIRLILPNTFNPEESDEWEWTSPEYPALRDMNRFVDSKANVTGKIWVKFSRKSPVAR